MMICSVCKDTNFYEDTEGAFCCASCGLQSQDYIPESNDLIDNFGEPSTTKQQEKYNFGRKKVKRPKFLKKKRKQKGTLLVDFLQVYQECLITIVEALPCNTTSFIAYVRYLWSEYLIVWMKSGCAIFDSLADPLNYEYDFLYEEPTADHTTTSTDINNIATTRMRGRARKYSSSSSAPSASSKGPLSYIRKPHHHPLNPNKPLLLGFLYLACRQQRFPMLPSDLIRWIQEGVIPYYALYNKAKHMSLKYRKLFVDGSTVIKPSNILFYCNCLAKSLSISVAPLNTPLIVRYTMISMGLPASVWFDYCKITQMLKNKRPIIELDTSNQSYHEHIIAQIVVACKFSEDWLAKWKLLKNSSLTSGDLCANHLNRSNDNTEEESISPGTSTFGSFPQTLYELSDVSRHRLPQLLHILKNSNIGLCQQYLSQGYTTFNRAIKNYITLNKNNNNSSSSSTSSIRALNNSNSSFWELGFTYSHGVSVNSVYNTGVSTFGPDFSCNVAYYSSEIKENSRCNHRSQHQENDLSSSSTIVSYSMYNTHKTMKEREYDGDSGMYLLNYIVTLERFAKFLLIKPGILHRLVEDIEEQMLTCIETKNQQYAKLQQKYWQQSHHQSSPNNIDNRSTKQENDEYDSNGDDNKEEFEVIKQQFQSKVEKLGIYRMKANTMFPEIHEAAVNRGTLELLLPSNNNDNNNSISAFAMSSSSSSSSIYNSGSQYSTTNPFRNVKTVKSIVIPSFVDSVHSVGEYSDYHTYNLNSDKQIWKEMHMRRTINNSSNNNINCGTSADDTNDISYNNDNEGDNE